MSFRLLRILTDSLPGIIATSSAGILTLVVWQVVDAVKTSKQVHVLEEIIVAAAAAEEAAFRAVEQELSEGEALRVESSSGMLCSASLSGSDLPAVDGSMADDLRELLIEVRGRNQRYYTYRCDLLAGAAPEALGYPLSLRRTALDSRADLRRWIDVRHGLVPTLFDDAGLPRLLDAPVSVSPQVLRHTVARAGLRQDDSIALLRTPSGTDLQDHVFVVDQHGICRPRVPRSGTIHLPGHVWLDQGSKPLIIELSRALTVVARGNIYLGRSLRVTGPGKLVLVAQRGDSELFADRDADGRWSADDRLLTGERYRGPVEGTGAIYLGLPGQGADRGRPGVELTIGASLYAQGEVHLVASRAEVHGSLVMGQGITSFGEPSLVLTGHRLPNTAREGVPGFHCTGARRPGLLTARQR